MGKSSSNHHFSGVMSNFGGCTIRFSALKHQNRPRIWSNHLPPLTPTPTPHATVIATATATAAAAAAAVAVTPTPTATAAEAAAATP